MAVRKAVIAVAGYGSRFFPVAKTINKCMLPVLDRPVLHWAVQDCLRAGVEQIAIITAPGDTQVRHYFTEDAELRDHFQARGWDAKYERIAGLHKLARFTFLEQPRDGRYGTAIPPLVAEAFVAGDDFLCMSGDDLLLREDGGSDMADLVAARERAGAAAAVAAAVVPGTAASRYGVLRARSGGDMILDRLVEKPTDWTAPEAHAYLSRAVLPGDIMTYLGKLTPAANGELQITDAINDLAAASPVLIHPTTGTYLDCGDPGGMLAANLAAARAANLQVPGIGWR
ncbi:sugar phosphate nucleotidyltransferase [Actinomadura terrae]|uniref:sugar phosphate nucleotidyltransferase n=1 Tax=Actinomadura terrae TaxID=604353 RepID=UPI001FA7B1A4|nr:sugar phosphate nucleotidyltransferase [Actinomadura terrae]